MSPNGVTSVNGNSTATYGFTRNSNPDLRWEVKKTFDVGVDAGVLDGKLYVDRRLVYFQDYGSVV